MAAGFPLLAWLAGPRRRPGAALYALLLGLGTIGLAAFGCGLSGWFSRGMVVVLLTPGAVAGLRRVRDPRAVLTRVRNALRADPWLAAGLAAAGWAQGAALVAGFAPPHLADELVAHLGLGVWDLTHHRICPQPGNIFSAFPQAATMLYAVPLACGTDFGIAWLHAGAGWLTAAGIAVALRPASPGVRRWAVLAVLASPALVAFAGRSFSDLFLAAYAAAAWAAALGGAPAALVGALAGLAAGHKVTGLLLAAALTPLLRGRRAAGGIAMALAAAPWLVRSWLTHGNPVHPLLWRWFPAGGWDAVLEARYRLELLQGDRGPLDRLLELAGLAWLLPVRNLGSGADGTTGALAALAAPLVFLGGSVREAAALALFLLPGTWGATGLRFLFPVLPLAITLAGRGADRVLGGAGGPWRRAAPPLAAALLLWQAAEAIPVGWAAYGDPLPVALGEESVSRYLDRRSYPLSSYPPGWSRLTRALADRVPPGGRILFLNSWGGIWRPARPCLITPLQGRPLALTLARAAGSPGELHKRFRQLGVTQVLVNRWQDEMFFDHWKVWDWDDRSLGVWIHSWDRYARPGWSHGQEATLSAWSDTPITQPHRLTPGFEEETVRLTMTLLRSRRPAEAERLIDNLLPLFPANPELRLAECIRRAGAGQFDLATAAARRIAALAPGSAADLRARAELLSARHHNAEAARLLVVAARREPAEPFPWLELAVQEFRAGNPAGMERARREYERARNFLAWR